MLWLPDVEKKDVNIFSSTRDFWSETKLSYGIS